MRTFLGMAYLAAMHRKFPAKQAFKVFKGIKYPGLAVLPGTFGNKWSNIELYLEKVSDRPHLLELYLVNNVCLRKGNCKVGEVAKYRSQFEFNRRLERKDRRTFKKIERRIRTYSDFIASNRTLDGNYVLTLGLEDNYTERAARKLFHFVKLHWDYKVARNGLAFSSPRGIDYHELHQTYNILGHNDIGTLDGQDINFPHRDPTLSNTVDPKNVREWLSRNHGKVKALLLWSALHQGLEGDSRKAPPPRRRNPQVPFRDIVLSRKWLREVQD